MEQTPPTPSSSRVTRSSARQAATSSNPTPLNQIQNRTQIPGQDHSSQPEQQPPATNPRKRRAPAEDPSPGQPQPQPRRRSKKLKPEIPPPPPPTAPAGEPPLPTAATARRRGTTKAAFAMSGAGSPAGPSEEAIPSAPTSAKRGDKKKNKSPPSNSHSRSTSSRRSKKGANHDDDTSMSPTGRAADKSLGGPGMEDDEAGEAGEARARLPYLPDDGDDDDHPFSGGFLGRHGGLAGISGQLRALTGMMGGASSRLRTLLDELRKAHDPDAQMAALQELSEVLLVSNEDTLAGHFHPDQYVKELVTLMQPNELTGEENQEMMLLACRCLANLMEAMPPTTANVVYGGAVPVLCAKLLEINYIDLAEQALSTLEKISVEFPGSIVREGGLNACLTYLDFFATPTQRSAVTTAANCCRNIPEDSFASVRDVMPILLNVLSNSDQKVLEQGCLCVSRIVESFKYHDSKLEELISEEMLRAILRLLIPGTTNLIGPSIHTQFLRVLTFVARASAKRSAELFRMNVVDTLYQILTGVSAPTGSGDVKTDSVVIMQALIHRPRDQILETLNVICELLPNVQRDGLLYLDELSDAGIPPLGSAPLAASAVTAADDDKKLQLLQTCHEELERFAVVLLPTLTDAYSSTVNLHVRQKVLTAHLKMISNLEAGILEKALRSVPYASFLASILSQQDHSSLVTYALQAAELLLKRLDSIYRYQFYREGVISEISKLASRPCKTLGSAAKPTSQSQRRQSMSRSNESSIGEVDLDEDEPVHERDDESDQDEEGGEEHDHDEDDDDDDDDEDDASSSDSNAPDEHHKQSAPQPPDVEDLITLQAKRFLEAHETNKAQPLGLKASNTLDELKQLAHDIRQAYGEQTSLDGTELFARLADYFDGDALESITSYELLTSDMIQGLLEVLSEASPTSISARSAFLQAFMGPGSGQGTATAFSILVSKLQDLLSRAEHFEVITAHHSAFETNRSSAASLLAKQLRLKLAADEDSDIPVAYRNIMVSIHAIATFSALNDYLRPRISLAERRPPRSREGIASAMAAYAAAFGGRDLEGRRLPIPPLAGLPADLLSGRMRGSRRGAPDPASSAAPESASSTPTARSSSRKSSRRSAKAPQPPPPPPPDDGTGGVLECADEEQLVDDEEMDEEAALDAIVGELEGDVHDDEPDPDAVNMEVAATGKVTARKEDGTRVATPLGGTPAAKPSTEPRASTAARAASLETPTSSRSMSYAAAIQAVPQDWHLEFSIDDQPISNETTIYRAVHLKQVQPGQLASRNIFQPVHTINFKRVSGPPPAEPTGLSPPPDTVMSATTGLPASLDEHPTTSAILRLLSILHGLNSNIDDVLAEHREPIRLTAEPLSQFVNTKLTAKLNRQLEEPLIVASNCLPNWSEDLSRFYPFLFPFETRHLFLQSTSFGYSRSMTRWQSGQDANNSSRHRHRDERPFLGRLQRQKVRISRSRILESGLKVMEIYGSSPSILEVEYFEEVGTGLGPTLEFYSSVSKEFSKKRLKLWRETDSTATGEFAFGKRGLFPAPLSKEQAENENGKKVLHLFRMLGKFIARSMLDSRIIDVSLNPTFFRIANNDGPASVTPNLGALQSVDAGLANSLKLVKQFVTAKRRIDEDPQLSAAQKVAATEQVEIEGIKVEDLALDFTLPGYPKFELVPNGSNVSVTTDNVSEYFAAVLDATLGSGVQRQIDEFKEGFSQVFPFAAVRVFTPEELVMLFGRADEDWSLETLMDSIKADHGFNLDSKSVRNLLTIMSELDAQQRREFLQFITGSPKLPIGGFKSLTPMFTVVCKPSEGPYTSDDYLPSVMTCVNYLKLPDYSSLEVMRKKLGVAVQEGQGAFHLS